MEGDRALDLGEAGEARAQAVLARRQVNERLGTERLDGDDLGRDLGAIVGRGPRIDEHVLGAVAA